MLKLLDQCPIFRKGAWRASVTSPSVSDRRGVDQIVLAGEVSERGKTLLSRRRSPKVADPQRKLDEGVATEDEGATEKQPSGDRIVPHDDRQHGGEDWLEQVDQRRPTGGHAGL